MSLNKKIASYNEELEEERKIKSASSLKRETSQRKYINFSYSGTKIANNNAKAVMVKLIKNLNKKGSKNCLNYVVKNSENHKLIDDNGNIVSADEVFKDCSKDFSDKENAKETWHLIFSIKENMLNPKILKGLEYSVKEVMANQFFGYKYALALHTHQSNPHIHIILNKRNIFTDKKIHFKDKEEIREFFNDTREKFALALQKYNLNYVNKNSLEKDLKHAYNKAKENVNFDFNNKEKISDIYRNLQSLNSNKLFSTQKRIENLKEDYDNLKKDRLHLIELLNQYKKKKNKKFFKIAKQIKENSKILDELGKEITNSYKTFSDLEKNKINLNENFLSHYKDLSQNLILQANFLQNYEKLYPRHKNATKKDIETYFRVKKAYELAKRSQAKQAQSLSENSFAFLQTFHQNENIFNLNKKAKILDKNIYILKHENIDFENKTKYLKQLEANKEFINELCQKRFLSLENSLIKAKKEKGIDKNSFLYKEYQKSLEILDKKPSEELRLKLSDLIKNQGSKQGALSLDKGKEFSRKI